MLNVDWKDIYDTQFVFFDDCWKTCDGYCCKNFFGGYLNILDKDSVVLPMLEDEFLYYQSIGGISNITDTPKKQTFTLKNGKEFTIYFLSCKCKGMCEPHSSRPIICKIYPYFPIVDYNGEILGYENCALMDIFYSDKHKHKCTLVNTHNIQLSLQLDVSMKKLLKYPIFIFTFMVMKLFIDKLRDNMPHKIDLLDDNGKKKFFLKYEMNILSGKPWKRNSFADEIVDIYNKVASRYGADFL